MRDVSQKNDAPMKWNVRKWTKKGKSNKNNFYTKKYCWSSDILYPVSFNMFHPFFWFWSFYSILCFFSLFYLSVFFSFFFFFKFLSRSAEFLTFFVSFYSKWGELSELFFLIWTINTYNTYNTYNVFHCLCYIGFRYITRISHLTEQCQQIQCPSYALQDGS